MGRNLKFVLEDDHQQAVCEPFFVVPVLRPPKSAGTRHIVSVSRVEAQPAEEAGRSHRRCQVANFQQPSSTLPSRIRFDLFQQTREDSLSFATLWPLLETASCKAQWQVQERPVSRAHRINEQFHFTVPARGTRRSQSQGGVGGGCCFPGGGGRSSGRGREEVGAVVGGGASNTQQHQDLQTPPAITGGHGQGRHNQDKLCFRKMRSPGSESRRSVQSRSRRVSNGCNPSDTDSRPTPSLLGTKVQISAQMWNRLRVPWRPQLWRTEDR